MKLQHDFDHSLRSHSHDSYETTIVCDFESESFVSCSSFSIDSLHCEDAQQENFLSDDDFLDNDENANDKNSKKQILESDGQIVLITHSYSDGDNIGALNTNLPIENANVDDYGTEEETPENPQLI